MNNYWTIIAVTIGYLYSIKYGREAIAKINRYNADKKDKQNQ